MMRNFLKDREEGSFLAIAAVAIPVLIVGVGLAVDVTRYMKTSGYVQSAVDQAAIAAAAVDGKDRNKVVKDFVNASIDESMRQYVKFHNVKSSEHFPPGGPLRVNVSVKADIDLAFGDFVGMETLSIERSSQALRNVDNVEAVLVLASGGTMCSHKERFTHEGQSRLRLRPDNSCGHFEAMKQGVREFVNIVEDNDTVADFKVGLVPYNHKVRMPNVNRIPPSMLRNENAEYFRDVSDAEPLSPVVPLTSDMKTIRRLTKDLRQTPQGLAWSRSDLGSHVAGLMFDPSHSQFFNNHSPASFGDRSTKKVMILMSDGANVGCCFTNWPISNFKNQFVYTYEPSNRDQAAICEELKSNGVQIFTILFDVSDSDKGGQEVNDVFARCASGAYTGEGSGNGPQKCSEKQNCYNVGNDEDLIRAYKQIAHTFYAPVISK